MYTLLKNKYLPWSEDITREVWDRVIKKLEEDGYTAYHSGGFYEDFVSGTMLTYASYKYAYKVYRSGYEADYDKPTTVAELLGEEATTNDCTISFSEGWKQAVSSINTGTAQLNIVSSQSYSILDLINTVPNHFIHSHDTGIKVPSLKYTTTYPEYIEPSHTKVSLDIDIDAPHILTLSKKHKVSNIKLNIE